MSLHESVCQYFQVITPSGITYDRRDIDEHLRRECFSHRCSSIGVRPNRNSIFYEGKRTEFFCDGKRAVFWIEDELSLLFFFLTMNYDESFVVCGRCGLLWSRDENGIDAGPSHSQSRLERGGRTFPDEQRMGYRLLTGWCTHAFFFKPSSIGLLNAAVKNDGYHFLSHM